MTSDQSKLPDIGATLAPILQRVVPAQQPLLIALAERMAAVRYREWAAAVRDPAQQAELHACAGREEEIAARVEALYPDAAAIQQELRRANPDLDAVTLAIFADRPLQQQFAIQARGERLGATTWRAFARQQSDAQARQTLLDCAVLEELSAVVLEALRDHV